MGEFFFFLGDPHNDFSIRSASTPEGKEAGGDVGDVLEKRRRKSLGAVCLSA